jgi:hypothetical protein
MQDWRARWERSLFPLTFTIDSELFALGLSILSAPYKLSELPASFPPLVNKSNRLESHIMPTYHGNVGKKEGVGLGDACL